MRSVLVGLLALVVLGATLPACATAEEKAAKKAAQKATQEAELLASVPADSPLAKLRLGMSEGEVTAVLGQQDSMDTHMTGKAFNPFNFAGKDVMRTTYYFKGVGRVEFSAGSWGQRNGVIQLFSDTTEPGYRRTN